MHAQNEAWYLAFNADVEFRIAMTPEDLKKAGLGDFPRQRSPLGRRGEKMLAGCLDNLSGEYNSF